MSRKTYMMNVAHGLLPLRRMQCGEDEDADDDVDGGGGDMRGRTAWICDIPDEGCEEVCIACWICLCDLTSESLFRARAGSVP